MYNIRKKKIMSHISHLIKNNLFHNANKCWKVLLLFIPKTNSTIHDLNILIKGKYRHRKSNIHDIFLLCFKTRRNF